MKTLYVSDLDGTLLDQNATLSRKTRDILNMLSVKGMHFTYATARSIHSASLATKGLSLHTPLIVYNGVFIIDPVKHTPRSAHYFSHKQADMLLDYLLIHQQYPFVYAIINGRERVSYMRKGLHEGGIHYLNNRINDSRFRCVDDASQLYEGDIFYVTCIHEKDYLYPHYQTLCKMDIAEIVFQQELYREEYWMELFPKHVSKASAIQELKELGGFDRLVCFGDAMNDLKMFSVCDESYAVSNAVPQLKERACGVIGSNQEDAVAVWLLEHVKGSNS